MGWRECGLIAVDGLHMWVGRAMGLLGHVKLTRAAREIV